jgi:SAM-dependent methyltransferase
MSGEDKGARHDHHHGAAGKPPEPFFLEMLPRIPRGLALDIAAGNGRHSLAMARAGNRVIAVDKSPDEGLRQAALARRLPIWSIVGDIDDFPLRPRRFDAIVNINYLDRALFPKLIEALKPGGVLIADTFLVEQATIGHPRNPAFLLNHDELRELMRGLELEVSREGLVGYPDGTRAWRSGAVGRKLA